MRRVVRLRLSEAKDRAGQPSVSQHQDTRWRAKIEHSHEYYNYDSRYLLTGLIFFNTDTQQGLKGAQQPHLQQTPSLTTSRRKVTPSKNASLKLPRRFQCSVSISTITSSEIVEGVKLFVVFLV